MKSEKYNGIVEGFFSHPLPIWNNRERLETIKFLADHCPQVNTYLYCPKNDTYVADKWSKTYPKSKLSDIAAAFSLCQEKGIRFVYGLNPGFTLESVERDFDGYIETIVHKLDQFSRIGVRTFCILFDDIPYAYNVMADEASAQDARIGETHGKIMNTLLMQLNGRIDALWLCPSDYYFVRKTPYNLSLMRSLDKRIALIWTGDSIFTKEITADMLRQVQDVVGQDRKIIWWNNYPVNDCEHIIGTFHIGSFNNPEKGVGEQLSGMLVNPMREAFANAIAYYTFNQYLEMPNMYEREVAFERAFQRMFGSYSPSFAHIYASFSDKNVVDNDPREYAAKLLRIETSDDLNGVIESIRNDIRIIRESSPALSEDAGRFIDTTDAIVKRSEAYLALFEAISNGSGWAELFSQVDVFPVVPDKKYLTKQFRVITSRLEHTDSFVRVDSADSKLRTKMAALTELFNEYEHKNKLTIPPADARRLSRLVKDTIELERSHFMTALKELSAVEKVKRIMERSLINGY